MKKMSDIEPILLIGYSFCVIMAVSVLTLIGQSIF